MKADKISCADCRWSLRYEQNDYLHCFNPKQPLRKTHVWIVKGKQCKSMCSLARVGNLPGDCGIKAQYYEEKICK